MVSENCQTDLILISVNFVVILILTTMERRVIDGLREGVKYYFADFVRKGSPSLKNARSIWALPKWGEGGGSRPLPKWFGAFILRRIAHVQRGICLVWGV